MTVVGGKNVLSRIKGLSRGELAKICKKMATMLNLTEPVVAVDVSTLMFAVQWNVKSAAEYMSDFSTETGLTVLPVCDNDVRPAVKQETNKRSANREKARSAAYIARLDVRALRKRLNEEALTQQQRSDILSSIKVKEKQRRRKETASYRPNVPNLAAELQNELEILSADCINGAGGSVLKVVTAEAQADAYIAGRIRNKSAVMAFSTDADIPIFTGDCCISINSFKKKGFELTCPSREALQTVLDMLGSETKAKLVPASHPIFEGLKDDRLRALMMIIIGCDVFPSGRKGVGVPTLTRKIAEVNTALHLGLQSRDDAITLLHRQLMNYMKLEFKSMSAGDDLHAEQVVNTLIDALVYEPVNEAGADRCYIGGTPPDVLYKYCEEFAASNTTIEDGLIVMTCKGVGGKEHPFLAADCHGICAKCNSTVCKYCKDTIGMDTSCYCLLCAATESLVPADGTESAVPIEVKRRRLVGEFGWTVIDTQGLDSDEVEDALEVEEFRRDYRSQKEKVQFPLYPTAEMAAATTEKWEDLADINFKDGGAFLSDGSIEVKDVPGILKFFASVVTFAAPDTKHTTWKNGDSSIYDALPSMLIDFASKSRVDSGYRLLSRCLRHALDCKCPTLENKTATLIKHGDDIGIHIHTKVPASMRKKVVYSPGIVFTALQVLCCECDCQIGSEGDERIVCVHNFPPVFLLLLLLMDALAESLLMELAASLRSSIWDTSVWTEEEWCSMKQSVVTLAAAAGEDISEIDLARITLSELMDKFETGTEGRKEWKKRLKRKPKPEHNCCITDIVRFESTTAQAKKLTQRRPASGNAKEDLSPTNGEEDVEMSENSDRNLEEPNYVAMDLLMTAANLGDVLDSTPIGWQLLTMRAKKQRVDMNNREIISNTRALKKQWLDLIRLANKRCHRSSTSAEEHRANKRPRLDTTTPLRNDSYSQTHVVTPTELNPSDASLPNLLRRPGCPLPSRPTPNPSQKTKKARIHFKCVKKGCDNNDRDHPHLRFFRIPYRSPLRSKNPDKRDLINHAGIVLLRKEILDRTISDRSSTSPKCFVCEEHNFEEVSKSTTVKLNDGEGINLTYKLVVPSGAGPSTVNKTLSRGTGRDRSVRKFLQRDGAATEEDGSNGDDRWAMCAQKMAETHCVDQHRVALNASVADAANLPLEKGNADTFIDSESGKLFRATLVTQTVKNRRKVDDPPVVKPGMSDNEVRRRTGFPSQNMLLSYIIVVCNCDVDKIKQRQTSLTWYEEWFMHFEYQWNRSATRHADIQKMYSDLRKEDILKVVDAKLRLCRESRRGWPMFASFEEDKALRKAKRNSRYRDKRPVFWDMTNIPAYGFTDAHWQSLTFSSYYNENCFKAGVFVQLCGWMGVTDAWTGSISDTDFNRREGYLKKQQQFQEKDLVIVDGQPKVVPFLNVYDKGYRAKMAAWENGKQLVLQPDFKDSDKKFNRDQTISSASVASDRGGNERVVNVSKRAGLISKGFLPNADPTRFNNVWTTFSHQANFMWDPVL